MSEEQLIATPGVFGETGNFLLERELGRGGMGGVYMGRDKMLDRPVAVKVMLKEYGSDVEFVEKFKREAQAAARLIHPNIAQIYSYGIADGMPYIAMELVAGGSLWSIMQNAHGQTDIVRVMKIGEQVAQALRCAADQGLVHGDIKPENILLDSNGNAKIVDFGLAAMQKDTNEIWGTPYYIAPEKVKKEVVDFRADMYNLGGTLYHALTGVAPFEGPDATAVVKARFAGPPKKPSEVRPDISAPIDRLIMRMLEADKSKRFPSFEALLEEFKLVLTKGLVPGAEKPAEGGVKRKKPVLKVRRMSSAAGEDQEDVEESADMRTAKGRLKLKGANRRRHIDNADADDSDAAGSKFGLVVVCVIAAILLVIGGLVWYQVASRKAEEQRVHALVVQRAGEARTAIRTTCDSAEKFAEDLEAIAEEAQAECKKPLADLEGKVPEDVFAQFKFEPTQELLDAIASTNRVEEAPEAKPVETNASYKVKTVIGEDGKTSETKVVKEEKPVRVRRVIEEYDPADPDAKPPADAKDPAAPAEAEAAEAAPEQQPEAAPEPPKETPRIVKEINELWNRACGAKAGAVRVRQQVRELLAFADKADKLTDETEVDARALGELSTELVDRFNKIKEDPAVESIRKAVNFIKNKAKKEVKDELNRIRVAKLEADRAAAKAAEEEAKQERLAAAEAAHKKLIEEEVAAAKAKYEDLITQGLFRSLSWSTAIRQLSNMKRYAETAEGGIAAGFELRKVEAMKLVQDTFITNMVDYTFTKSLLKGYTVTKVDATRITFLKPDGKTPQKIEWTKIYSGYHGNLNELINRYIEKGQANAKLNKKNWCEAMMGAALTMRVICSDDPAAVTRGEAIAKRAISEFPDYQKLAEEFFPDIDFAGIDKSDNL